MWVRWDGCGSCRVRLGRVSLEIGNFEREMSAVDDARRVHEAHVLELRGVHFDEHETLRATRGHVVADDRVAELHGLVGAHEHVEDVLTELDAVADDQLVARMERGVEPIQSCAALRIARATMCHERGSRTNTVIQHRCRGLQLLKVCAEDTRIRFLIRAFVLQPLTQVKSTQQKEIFDNCQKSLEYTVCTIRTINTVHLYIIIDYCWV